jgi:hypothetical protein
LLFQLYHTPRLVARAKASPRVSFETRGLYD